MHLYLASLPLPGCYFDDALATQASWKRSTVAYLIRKVDESDKWPADVISEFIDEVNKRDGIMYHCAYDIATDLYDRLFL